MTHPGPRIALAGLAFLALVGSALAVSAATDDSWAAFRKDVEAKCLGAAKDLFAVAAAQVDPFGSEHFGLALIRGKAKGADPAEISAICVYDKVKKSVEIGGELPTPA